jgi:arsenate reductase (thioredoxin)
MLRSGGRGLKRPANLLVLCTGNSARSILGEALFNQLGEGRLRAFSAGSRPAGEVHPAALRLLRRRHFDVRGLRSKSWDEFVRPGAAAIDLVITVCGSAAGEACPVFPGRALRAHWGLADPACLNGAQAAEDEAFERTYELLRRRVEAFLGLAFETLPAADLQRELNAIGAMEGAA